MVKKDRFVHGMDWTKKIKNYELDNYRKYQYDLIGKYVGENILEVGSGEKGFTKEIIKNKKNIKRLISIEPSKILFNLHKNIFKFPKFVSFYMKDLFKLRTNTYGPFEREDISSLPIQISIILINKKRAEKIEIE